MERKHIDFVSAIIMLILSVYVVFESISYYHAINRRIATAFHQSPGFFPAIVGGALLVCSILLLVKSLKGGAFTEIIRNIKEGSTSFLKSPVALRSFLGCAWMGIYIFGLLPTLSFVLGSFIFLIVMIVALELPTLKAADTKTAIISVVRYVVIAGVTVGAISGLFQGIFRVPLP